MFDTLAPKYWEEFKSVVVKITEPNQAPYEKTLERLYQERADDFNQQNVSYHVNLPNETAKSCFIKAIENAAIRILDDKYILKYAVMRHVTYTMYHYYEDNCPYYECPQFDLYKDGSCIAGISQREWRWWVDEMNY